MHSSDELLTREEFAAWLEEQPAGRSYAATDGYT